MAPRREHLGPRASAALPALWKALARLDWTHADFARGAGMTSAGATRLLYGDTSAGRRVAAYCADLGVRLVLWEKPCPPNWRPHDYPDVRKRAARDAGSWAAE